MYLFLYTKFRTTFDFFFVTEKNLRTFIEYLQIKMLDTLLVIIGITKNLV